MKLSFADAGDKVIVTVWDAAGEKVLLVAHLPVGTTITNITDKSITWIETAGKFAAKTSAFDDFSL